MRAFLFSLGGFAIGLMAGLLLAAATRSTSDVERELSNNLTATVDKLAATESKLAIADAKVAEQETAVAEAQSRRKVAHAKTFYLPFGSILLDFERAGMPLTSDADGVWKNDHVTLLLGDFDRKTGETTSATLWVNVSGRRLPPAARTAAAIFLDHATIERDALSWVERAIQSDSLVSDSTAIVSRKLSGEVWLRTSRSTPDESGFLFITRAPRTSQP